MKHDTSSIGYGALMRDGRFQAFLWTQFLGAFNDNVYKMIVLVSAVAMIADKSMQDTYSSLSGAVFVLPFLLFAGWAGQIADRFSKTSVLRLTKAWEMVVMLGAMAALALHNLNLMLLVLFMLALQANFFSPAKYGILPEVLPEAQLSKANGLLELTTFAAIVLGTLTGGKLFIALKAEPLVLGGILLAIAVLGSITSIWIPKAAPSGASDAFRWNPFAEVWAGAREMFHDRPMWLTMMGNSYFWFVGALFQLATFRLGIETLHLSEDDATMLFTALAVGIGLGSVVAGSLSGNRVELGLVPIGGAMLGTFAVAVSFAHSFWTVSFWLAATGFAGGLFAVPLNAFLQDEAKPEEKGRVLTTNNFFNMIAVLVANGLWKVLHDPLQQTPGTILAEVGVLTLVSNFYTVWLLPAPLFRLLSHWGLKFFFDIHVVGVENLPKKGGAVIAPNHVSYADAILLSAVCPRFVRFLMYQPLYENKWLNPVCRLFEAIPIAQGSPKESLRALKEARKKVEDGEIVGIFPEGKLTRSGHVKPFERGIELMLRGLDETPVVPIYIDGMWGHALSVKGGGPMKSRLALRHRVTIYIGEALPASEATAERLYQRVTELGTLAAAERKDAAATLGRRLVATARKQWSKPALADSTGKRLTYGETLIGAMLLRDWIVERCGEAKSVGLLLPASSGGAIANLAVALAGKTAVNLNFTTGEPAMRHAIERCGISTILSSRAFLEKGGLPELLGTVCLEDILPTFGGAAKLVAAIKARLLPANWIAGPAKPDDTAAVIFSSGSTGTPKGVELSHWNLIANIESVAQVYSVGPGDCMLGALPFFHSFGYTYTLWFPILNQFRSVFHANPADAKAIGELAGEHKPTIFLSMPTFCMGYLRRCTREQLGTIRYLLVGAEKLQAKLADAFYEKFGVTPLEGYGCTEMGPVVSVNVHVAPMEGEPEWPGNRVGSGGRPLPNVSIRIVHAETGELLPSGDTGLLLVNGPSRMIGYLGDADRTAKALRDGYYDTGDLAFIDKDGFLHIAGRMARFSKIAGEMVPHLKIEEAVQAMMTGGSCAVVGVPDEQRGERIVILYTDQSFAPADLWRRLCDTDLPRLWVPKQDSIRWVESIPTLGTGKLDLAAARRLAAEA